jgi:hypothetical protein
VSQPIKHIRLAELRRGRHPAADDSIPIRLLAPTGGGDVRAVIHVIGLMFGVAGDRQGQHLLRDYPDAKVDILIDPVARLTFDNVRTMPGESWSEWVARDDLRCERGEVLWARVVRCSNGQHASAQVDAVWRSQGRTSISAGQVSDGKTESFDFSMKTLS